MHWPVHRPGEEIEGAMACAVALAWGGDYRYNASAWGGD